MGGAFLLWRGDRSPGVSPSKRMLGEESKAITPSPLDHNLHNDVARPITSFLQTYRCGATE